MDATGCQRTFKANKTHGHADMSVPHLCSHSAWQYSSLRLASLSESQGINKKQFEKRAVKKVVVMSEASRWFWTFCCQSRIGGSSKQTLQLRRELKPKAVDAVVLNLGYFAPPGDTWQCLETSVVVTSDGVLLLSSWQRPGMLLKFLQYTGQSTTTKNDLP